METVVAWRAEPVEDEYGNPVAGEPAVWHAFSGLVAPAHGGEDSDVTRRAVITGYTVYIENQGPTGIVETDLIQLPDRHGDRLLPVDGLVGEWRRRDGSHKGDQLTVKAVRG